MGIITPIRRRAGKVKSNHIRSVVGPWSVLRRQSTSGHPAGTMQTWPAAPRPVLLGAASLCSLLPPSQPALCGAVRGNSLRTSQIPAQLCPTPSSGPGVQPEPLQASATCRVPPARLLPPFRFWNVSVSSCQRPVDTQLHADGDSDADADETMRRRRW